MRIGIFLNEWGQTLDQVIDQARKAKERGFPAVWSAQIQGFDALTALAVIGARVPGLDVGTAVVPTYPRHPIMLASQALTVQAATGNRLTLGIGLSHRTIIENQFGISYDKPARHMRDYLSTLIPLLHGEDVSYQGETLKAVSKLSVAGAEPPSVIVAAHGPEMLRLTGTLADGVASTWTGPKTLGNYIVPSVVKAASAAGRPDPRVVIGIILCVTDDAATRRAEFAKQFAMAGETPSYRDMFDREGWSGPGDAVIVGDEITVERELRRYHDAGATELIAIPMGAPEEIDRTLSALSTLSRTPIAA